MEVKDKMDNNKEFTWIPFYMEFADKLKEYINQRDELIRIIIGIYNNLDMKLPTLEKKRRTINIY